MLASLLMVLCLQMAAQTWEEIKVGEGKGHWHSQTSVPDSNFQIYLCFGQSNMVLSQAYPGLEYQLEWPKLLSCQRCLYNFWYRKACCKEICG